MMVLHASWKNHHRACGAAPGAAAAGAGFPPAPAAKAQFQIALKGSRGARGPQLDVKFAGASLQLTKTEGVFEGYASLFGLRDLGGDIVQRGAFRESLMRRGAAGVRMLWQHDPAEPIGAWDIIREDDRGLYVRGRLDLAVARAREVLALIRSRAIDGLSIGFKTQRSRRDPASGFRKLEKLDLWEVSIVTFPMLPQARVASVKDADGGRADPAALVRAIRRATAALNA